VTARHTVTLYDNMRLTGVRSGPRPLSGYDTNATDDDDGFYPIPDAGAGSVYNVVEVRVTVW
jgi:hypothetical protein